MIRSAVTSEGRVLERTGLVLTLMLLIGLSVALWHVSRVKARMVESTALRSVARYSQALAEFRSVYTSEVVARLLTIKCLRRWAA